MLCQNKTGKFEKGNSENDYKLPKTKPKTSPINNTKNTRAIMLIFFKRSPGLCPREVRVVNCCPAHTLFHKGRYANSPYLTTLPALPYIMAFHFSPNSTIPRFSELNPVPWDMCNKTNCFFGSRTRDDILKIL